MRNGDIPFLKAKPHESMSSIDFPIAYVVSEIPLIFKTFQQFFLPIFVYPFRFERFLIGDHYSGYNFSPNPRYQQQWLPRFLFYILGGSLFLYRFLYEEGSIFHMTVTSLSGFGYWLWGYYILHYNFHCSEICLFFNWLQRHELSFSHSCSPLPLSISRECKTIKRFLRIYARGQIFNALIVGISTVIEPRLPWNALHAPKNIEKFWIWKALTAIFTNCLFRDVLNLSAMVGSISILLSSFTLRLALLTFECTLNSLKSYGSSLKIRKVTSLKEQYKSVQLLLDLCNRIYSTAIAIAIIIVGGVCSVYLFSFVTQSSKLSFSANAYLVCCLVSVIGIILICFEYPCKVCRTSRRVIKNRYNQMHVSSAKCQLSYRYAIRIIDTFKPMKIRFWSNSFDSFTSLNILQFTILQAINLIIIVET